MATCEYFVFNGGKWEQTFSTEDPARVYGRLASCLVRKYKWQAPTIGRILDEPEYATGERIITVYHQYNGHKAKEVYKVEI